MTKRLPCPPRTLADASPRHSGLTL